MQVRFGHFNIRDLSLDKLLEPHPQVKAAAAIIRRMRPHILSVNEMEYDPRAPEAFCINFLEEGAEPLRYPHRVVFPTNSGIPTAHPPPFDFKGYGVFPGQYAIALLSMFPLARSRIRGFLNLPWSDAPHECRLKAEDAPPPDYPLMSTNMLDVPVRIDGTEVRLILLHATPPIRGYINVIRNESQICLLNRYVSGLPVAGLTDGGKRPFVVMGDLNADFEKGEGGRGAITGLIDNPLIHPIVPVQDTFLEGGGAEKPLLGPGGLRLKLDYILPSREFTVVDSGVFWPEEREWWVRARRASDHFFVHVDCEMP